MIISSTQPLYCTRVRFIKMTLKSSVVQRSSMVIVAPNEDATLRFYWSTTVVQSRRLHDYAECANQTDCSENPKEQPIQHHGNKLPILFHLMSKKNIIRIVSISNFMCYIFLPRLYLKPHQTNTVYTRLSLGIAQL